MFGHIRPTRGSLLLAGTIVVLLLSQPALALYTTILFEEWEKPVNTWPFTTYGNTWAFFPNPPSPASPTWDVEFDAIYHQTAPEKVQSVWCAGSNDQLQPGVHTYRPNQLSFLYWGSFSLQDALFANGSFWYWAKMEINTNDNGEFFGVGVKQGGFSQNLNDWDWLYQDNAGGTDGAWVNRDFDFEEVINGTDNEDTLSYLGLSNLTVALVFTSDGDMPVEDEHLGVFVDEFSMGADDGQFDFALNNVQLVNPDNPDEVITTLYVDQPAAVKIRFRAYGLGMSNVVDHTLYSNNNPVSVIQQAWLGTRNGEVYNEVFDLVFTPQQPGQAEITVLLNSNFNQDQEEADYANNDSTLVIDILPENPDPTLFFIQPAQGGYDLDPDAESVEIIYEAFNQPAFEPATLDLYWDDDGEGFDGTPIALGIPVPNGQASRTWSLIGYPNDDYWVYGVVDDDFNEPVSVYAEGPVMYGTDVAEKGASIVPDRFEVLSAYPNPFNPTVEVRYAMPAPGEVTASWYSIDGRLVERIALGNVNAGEQSFAWTPRELTSGVYVLRLAGPAGTVSQKVTYLK